MWDRWWKYHVCLIRWLYSTLFVLISRSQIFVHLPSVLFGTSFRANFWLKHLFCTAFFSVPSTKKLDKNGKFLNFVSRKFYRLGGVLKEHRDNSFSKFHCLFWNSKVFRWRREYEKDCLVYSLFSWCILWFLFYFYLFYAFDSVKII